MSGYLNFKEGKNPIMGSKSSDLSIKIHTFFPKSLSSPTSSEKGGPGG